MDWREKYKDKLVSADEAVKCVESEETVAVGQINGMSDTLNQALIKRAGELRNVKIFSSLGFKGEPYMDEKYRGSFVGLQQFLSPSTRQAYLTGMSQLTPLHFHLDPYYIREMIQPEVAFVMVSSPDDDGNCSFSMNSDYIYESALCCKKLVLHINPAMPRTFGSNIHLDKAMYLVEAWEEPLDISSSRPGENEEKISRYIEPFIEDGATLQLGIGGIPDFVLTLLGDKKDLGIHSELIGDNIVDLHQKGVITNARKRINTGKTVTTSMLGSKKLFNFVNENKDVMLLPVDYVNDPKVIAQNDNVISINSCLQVDLLGQVNSDTINGRPYSGIGGQVDFIRGARGSKGGKSFLTLPSTAVKGEVSRIVFHLGVGSPVTTTRHDVDYVVTEYGVAHLWGRSVKERVYALVAIAHPNFRESLEKQAFEAGWLK